MSQPNSALVVVLERNRRVGQRIARVLTAAIGLGDVAYIEDVADLHGLVGETTRLVACNDIDVGDVAAALCPTYHDLRLLAWFRDDPSDAIAVAQKQPALGNILGWPSFQSMPRPWELALCGRRLCDPLDASPGLVDLLRWGAVERMWSPETTIDRDVVVAEVSQMVLQLGLPARAADRISEIAHELLMNAMYDAPVDRDGQPRYAYDRTQDLVLGETERPVVKLATDGIVLGLEVIDRFGGLTRDQVLNGVERGLRALDRDHCDDVVDTSHGGAGLGMAKIYRGSAALVCDVAPGHFTRVISLHELDISPREMRALPASLHYFHSP